MGRRLKRLARRHAALIYLTAIAALTTWLVAVGVTYARAFGASVTTMVVTAILLAIPMSDVAVGLVQRVALWIVHPRRLLRLDFLGGVPADARTMVIIPTLLTSVERAEELIEHLEVLALANLDPHIHFAILSDFEDSATRERPDDAAILTAAREGLAALSQPLRSGTRAIASFSSIATVCGIRANACGWGGNASAARSRNSTRSCAARRTRATSCRSAPSTCCRACGTA